MEREPVEGIEPISSKKRKNLAEAWDAVQAAAIPTPHRPVLFTPERFLNIVFDSHRDVYKRISANHHKMREENNEAIRVDQAARRKHKIANFEAQQKLENLNLFHRTIRPL